MMRRLQTFWRWILSLPAGFLALILLFLLFWVDARGTGAGLGSLITEGLSSTYGKRFALQPACYAEIAPLLLVGELFSWLAALAAGTLVLDRTWRSGWTWAQGFVLSLAGLVWIHWVYWWEVPTALWVIPGLSRLPILVALLLLLGLAVGLAYLGLRRVGRGQSWGRLRRLGVLLICLTAWGGLAELPLWLAQRTHPHAPSGHPVKALFLGIDGMRGDFRDPTGVQGLRGRVLSECLLPPARHPHASTTCSWGAGSRVLFHRHRGAVH